MRINEDNRPLYEKQCPEEANKYFLPFDFWLADILDSTGETKYSELVISTDMSPAALSHAEAAMAAFCKNEHPEDRVRQMIDEYYKILEDRGYYWR